MSSTAKTTHKPATMPTDDVKEDQKQLPHETKHEVVSSKPSSQVRRADRTATATAATTTTTTATTTRRNKAEMEESNLAHELTNKMTTWKRRNAAGRGKDVAPTQRNHTGATVQAITGTASTNPTSTTTTTTTTTATNSRSTEKQLYEPNTDGMITVRERARRGRGRGRESVTASHHQQQQHSKISSSTKTSGVVADMNAEDASDSDSAGEPLEGKNSRKTRGLINIRGGRSGHEHERGRRGRGRGGRGGDRGGGMVRDRRFNSDDDENWYVPGEPDTELPEDIAPLPVEPAASILSESISSTVYTSKPPKDTRPHHSSTSQRRPKRGKPTRSTMPLYSISATNDPVDEFEPRDTSGIHPNERQLFDPNTGTLQTAPKSATSHDHTAGHRRHRSAKSREIHTSKSATAHQSTPSMGVHDLIQQLQSMIVQLEKRMAITAREYDDSEMTIDTSATTTTEADTVEYWRGHLDQCQSLLTCYTQWSKKYPTMDGIANAYGRIWKYGVYQCMDALRRRIKYKTQGVNDKEGKSTSSANQAITDNLRRLLNEHISMAEEFYQSTLSRLSAIFMTMSPNDMASSLVELGLWSCVMAMGDLSRYRGMFGLASGGEVDTLRRYWLKKSRAWYRWVTRFTPDNGKVYNQLAILASQHELEAFYYYSRSLTAYKHFDNARESLIMLIEVNRTRLESMNPSSTDNILGRRQQFERLFVQLHGMLFSKTSLEQFNSLLDQLLVNHLKVLLLVNDESGSSNANESSHYHAHYPFWCLFRMIILNLSAIDQHRHVSRTSAIEETDDEYMSVRLLASQLLTRFSTELWQQSSTANLSESSITSRGVLLYTIIIMTWLAGRGLYTTECNTMDDKKEYTNHESSSTTNMPFYQREAIVSQISNEFWQALADYLNIIYQLLDAPNDYQNGYSNSDHTFISTNLPPLPEDFELQGFPWSWVLLTRTNSDSTTTTTTTTTTSSSSLMAWDVTRLRDVEDAVELIDTDYGHWQEPDEHNSFIDQDEDNNVMKPMTFKELLVHRQRRAIALGQLLTTMVPELTWSTEDEQFIVQSLSLPHSTIPEPITIIDQLSLTEDEDEEDEEDDEEDDDITDTNGPLADLKARKRELESLLTADRHHRRYSNQEYTRSNTNRSISKSKRSTATTLCPSKITTLLIDTNMFIRDLSIIKRAIQSRQWTIILPLAVIIELDGLRKSESALGVAAREALAYLEAYFATPIAQRLGNESETLSSTMSASSLPVRVQTAKGNYLPNIQYRSESFHREDDADRWGDYSSKDNDEMTATVMMTTEENELHDTTHQHQHQQHSILNQSSTKTLDDIILEVCQLHPPETSVLVTGDANLRVKARSYGVAVMNDRQMKRLLR